MQKNSWISPKTEFKFTSYNKESFAISDFTYTLLPIPGSSTCQERPKCSALLMKKSWRNRGLGLLTSGLTSRPPLFMFWDNLENTPLSSWRPSFLLALFHQWEIFSPKCRSWYFLENMKHSPSTVILHPPLYHFLYLLFLFSLSPFLTFLSSSLSYSGLPPASVSLN